VYQPLFDAASSRVFAAEALPRWRHPLYGTLEPAAMRALAERSGVATALDHRLLDAACRHAAQWWHAGRPLAVAAALSPAAAADPRLATTAAQALQHSGLPPALLIVEIDAEALLADAHRAAGIRALRAAGARVAAVAPSPDARRIDALARLGVDALRLGHGQAPAGGLRRPLERCAGSRMQTFTPAVPDGYALRRMRYEQFEPGPDCRFARPLQEAALDRLLADGTLAAGRPA
jgi:hypothetical protein